MIYIVRINNKEYEVEVERGRANIIKATEITQSVDAPSAPQPTASATERAAVTAPATNAKVVAAPMPGTILDIKATPGKKVNKGEVLLILEAMKMENEIVAPEDGMVAQVFVTKGATVTTGDSLISIQ
ncbi:MAG: acetyl-CoA carboxylase biotin carboxyl carrier protein subunit [Clostridiales bacterium]|nr:acetyl-CoA carboxylase biotin carboxyl carrier protein subunit [Clostridiales bacterium]